MHPRRLIQLILRESVLLMGGVTVLQPAGREVIKRSVTYAVSLSSLLFALLFALLYILANLIHSYDFHFKMFLKPRIDVLVLSILLGFSIQNPKGCCSY